MIDEVKEPEGETPPVLPKPGKMVRVINTSKYKKFYLGNGTRLLPGQQGKIPADVFKKVQDTCTWLKRAERGDVI